MPFAGYEDFDACIVDNQDKEDAEAYCAEIQRQVEGKTSILDAIQLHGSSSKYGRKK